MTHVNEGIKVFQMRFERSLDLQYQGQTYSLNVSLPDGSITQELIERVTAIFHEQHDITYGHGNPHTFCEAIGGEFGARPSKDGEDDVHSHMTNTRNTPVKVIELTYPLRVKQYSLRPDTGGAGRFRRG